MLKKPFKMKVSNLFLDEPEQWGLRGDPYLWREMATKLERTDVPATADELKQIIRATYESSTGRVLEVGDGFIVERFSRGGMSSGGISPEFWIEKALPLLLGRHIKL
jgi:hypothetical protein